MAAGIGGFVLLALNPSYITLVGIKIKVEEVKHYVEGYET